MISTEKDEMRKWSRSTRSQGTTIGLVPTMGYLHQGHLSLVEEAHKYAEVTVVSVYVNPGQFSPSEDLSTYPSDFHGDILKLKSVPGGVDAVFAPKNLYGYRENKKSEIDVDVENKNSCKKGVVSCLEERGLGHETWVRVKRLEKGMCGKSRPVFFRGFATIVTKLFNIVEPDVAVFGKKDCQQWRIIQRMVRHFTVPNPLFLARMMRMMVRDLDFDIEIVGSDIVRDSDGLALKDRRSPNLGSAGNPETRFFGEPSNWVPHGTQYDEDSKLKRMVDAEDENEEEDKAEDKAEEKEEGKKLQLISFKLFLFMD
ncbi:hypothetical protein SLEP1_g676 [Rubroshorea leprosula]|uniref:Pantoate--beta-alanine ligase n=1 Tax=Rubroshorea leprosula TaxID=152421 RepID=A0AAV5HBA7_9ROSI|nr:hypothetical protein SLEP1_g676 [Rubroshorea leprosula]